LKVGPTTSNPGNPTGAFIPKSELQKIVKIAAAKSIYILSDEVYLPLLHSLEEVDPELPPSILQLGYKHVISIGSMSKAFALPGIRLGWIAAPEPEIIQKCFEARDYTTISCSVLSDKIATYALAEGTVTNLLNRNTQLARKGVQMLDDFVKQFPGKVSWIRPKTGTTAFIRFYKDGKPVEDDKFCEDVMAKTGVNFVPGKICFGNNEDFQGYIRIGYVCKTEILVKALEELKRYVEREL
jgi:aspartate/methionine/tyrosine aminotransferase